MLKLVDSKRGWETFGDFTITEFSPFLESGCFCLEHDFSIKLSNSDDRLRVQLDEEKLWEQIYKNEAFYTAIGPEACIILDFAFSLGGSEAVVESYYSVMTAHRKDGGLENENLDMRTMLDWSLPPVLSCPNFIKEVALVHRQGDVKGKVSKHRNPVFCDPKERALNKYTFSKVLDKQLQSSKGFSFIK